MRPERLAAYTGRLRVQSAALGDFVVEVPAVAALDRPVDSLWISTKATQLRAALESVPAEWLAAARVLPLLNGVAHMQTIRDHWSTAERRVEVTAAAIRVEAESVGTGCVRHHSSGVRVDVVGAHDIRLELSGAGIDARVRDDEATLLWEKLAFLAPVALATSAFAAPLGDVRGKSVFVRCREEVVRAAIAAGAAVDAAEVADLHERADGAMRSSMQRDIEQGRPPELDAISGPVLDAGRLHGFSVRATSELVDAVRERTRRAHRARRPA